MTRLEELNKELAQAWREFYLAPEAWSRKNWGRRVAYILAQLKYPANLKTIRISRSKP